MSEVRCTRTVDVGAYLLAGLPADEAAAFRVHADGCASCSAALAELQPVTDQLGRSDLRTFAGVAVEQPSPDLRERILERAGEFPPANTDGVVELQQRRSRRSIGWKAAAAAVVVAFGIGAGSGRFLRPATPQRYFGAGPNAVAQRVDFASASKTGPAAWAYLSSDTAGTYAVMYTKGLSDGKTYKWWLEKLDGTRVPMGSFVFPSGQQNWVVCPGGTSIERAELKAIGVSSDGKDVLRAELPAPLPS